VANVDGILTAMHAACDEALGATTCLDGWTGEDLPTRVVIVGFDPTGEGSPIATVEVADEGAGYDSAETVNVAVVAAVWDGDIDVPAKRAEVAAMLAKIGARLDEECRAGAQLGGTVLDVGLAPAEQWFTFLDDRGPSVQCSFIIRARVHS
jgi:hypothetical protein